MTVKHCRIKAQTVGDGLEPWRFNLVDMDTGKILPILAVDRATIEYNGSSEPIRATVTLLLSEIDIEAVVEVKV